MAAELYELCGIVLCVDGVKEWIQKGLGGWIVKVVVGGLAGVKLLLQS